MKAPPSQYRPCVGVALFNASGKVFIGRRAGLSGEHAWQMPQGGIDKGETPLAAAARELLEETGVSSARLLAEAPEWLAYDLPTDMIRPSWRGKFRGQAQKWFAFLLEGDDSHIDIFNPPAGHGPEFDAWRWAELSETPQLIIPFKREVYAQVAKMFAGFSKIT